MFKKYMDCEGREVWAERRRYSNCTFTWLYIKRDGEWEQLGDPWQCVNPPRGQVSDAIKYLDKLAHPESTQNLSCFL